MMKMIKKFTLIFFIIDIILISLGLMFADLNWLVNSQFAFVSSLLITLATFISYKNNVEQRIENFEDTEFTNTRDLIDEIDDVHDLYTEDTASSNKNLDASEVQTIINEEKQKVKKNYVANTVSGLGTFVSIYRIGGYFLLIMGLLYLSTNDIFEAIPYLIGLFVVPLSMLVSNFILKEEEDL